MGRRTNQYTLSGAVLLRRRADRGVYSHMQLVRPKVVAMAVRMETIMLMTIFQVSFLLSVDIIVRNLKLAISN